MANTFSQQGCLGASFFFFRDKDNLYKPEKLLTTIAYQLVCNVPALKEHIAEAIEEVPDIITRSVRDQWKVLVLEPLSKIVDPSTLVKNVIFMFNALDECGKKDDICLILRLLSEIKKYNIHYYVFLISRPDISNSFDELPSIERYNIVLHNVEQSVVDKDITLYFKRKFKMI